MKRTDWQEIEQILASVLEQSEEQRAARVDELCAGNSSLRNEVLSLLAAHHRAGSFMEMKTQIRSDSVPDLLLVNKQLGPYRLLESIGHGGMGTVYRAERADGQFQKQVAVKVVPAALHSAAWHVPGIRGAIGSGPGELPKRTHDLSECHGPRSCRYKRISRGRLLGYARWARAREGRPSDRSIAPYERGIAYFREPPEVGSRKQLPWRKSWQCLLVPGNDLRCFGFGGEIAAPSTSQLLGSSSIVLPQEPRSLAQAATPRQVAD